MNKFEAQSKTTRTVITPQASYPVSVKLEIKRRSDIRHSHLKHTQNKVNKSYAQSKHTSTVNKSQASYPISVKLDERYVEPLLVMYNRNMLIKSK